MLQKMLDEVAAEGKKEEAIYDEFMCYCTTTKGELDNSIAVGKEKIAALESAVEGGSQKLESLEAALASHVASRDEAEEAIYDEFMCDCTTTKGELDNSIAAGKERIAAQ